MKFLISTLTLLVTLSACGGGGGGSSSPSTAITPTNTDTNSTTPTALDNNNESLCTSQPTDVNWQALFTADCPKLTDYNLFQDPLDPTKNPLTPGKLFELNTQLFSDYANKYRFVFIPPGKKALYQPQEVFDFPLGTVLAKTFALPQDLGDNNKQNDTIIETRLLIHRAKGWTAITYQWQNSVATLAEAGADVPHTLVNKGNALSFTYHIPSRAQCKNCHQLSDENANSWIAPIGLKARFLNRIVNGHNQLQDWQIDGQLDGLPDTATIPTAYPIEDTSADLTARAKGYLDINCAHCHRAEGASSISGLRLGFFVDHTQTKYGICKQPPGYDGGEAGLNYDIVPGNGEISVIPYRIGHTQAKDRMPPIGRSLVHEEGVALIKEWINAMEPSLGSCAGGI